MKTKVAFAVLALLGLNSSPAVATAHAPLTGALTFTTHSASGATTADRIPAESLSQRNAKEKARSYLSFSAFSRKGLIDQLVFEGFSAKDAAYGVDALKVNWNAQAVAKAKSYLSTTAFSQSGLVDQLVFEGFTRAQATFGVAGSKANWNQQAAKKAKSYLAMSSFSRSALIEQLVFEGFTRSQATYGVGKAGL